MNVSVSYDVVLRQEKSVLLIRVLNVLNKHEASLEAKRRYPFFNVVRVGNPRFEEILE